MVKVRALISLLEDPDEYVFSAVRSALVREGAKALPILEELASTSDSALVRCRIENVMRRIEFASVYSSLIEWLEDGAEDLLQGAYLMAKFVFPELDFYGISSHFDHFERSVAQRVGATRSAQKQIAAINAYLFDTVQMKNNINMPMSHRYNCINYVLQHKCGNHITLSVIYAALCQRFDLPVQCVSLPKLMLVAYLHTDGTPLFYVNPTNRGEILSPEQVETYLMQQRTKAAFERRMPCNNQEVIFQLLRNFYSTYHLQNDNEYLGYVREMSQLTEGFL